MNVKNLMLSGRTHSQKMKLRRRGKEPVVMEERQLCDGVASCLEGKHQEFSGVMGMPFILVAVQLLTFIYTHTCE